MQAPLVACRKPMGSYNRFPNVFYVSKHKMQYLLIRAPYTRVVVFWHIHNMPHRFCSQICYNTPMFCKAAMCWGLLSDCWAWVSDNEFVLIISITVSNFRFHWLRNKSQIILIQKMKKMKECLGCHQWWIHRTKERKNIGGGGGWKYLEIFPSFQNIKRGMLLRWQKMISPSNWPFLKNHCIWTTIQASVVSFKRQN